MYVQNILLWTYEDIANSFHIKKKLYFFINRTQNHTFFHEKQVTGNGHLLLSVF